jgi:hypothetical protein
MASASPFIAAVAVAALAAGCASAPRPSGFLTSYERLDNDKGLRGKRLATDDLIQPNAEAALFIEPVAFPSDAEGFADITAQQRTLVTNQLARALCQALSRSFAIVDAPSPDAHRLRAAVTRITPNSRASAAATMITGLRPPLGLGGLTAEMEILGPDGSQRAAMVWTQDADMLSGGRISRIGDAYDYADAAGRDFADLVQIAGERRGFRLGPGPSDDACDAYGRENGYLTTGLGLIGIAPSPHISDRGPTPTGRDALEQNATEPD